MQLDQPIRQIAAELAKGDYSSRELTLAALERAKLLNERLNCFITIAEDHALAQAEQADQRIGRGQATPLTGIPITHKDIFCIDGMLTSCGSKMLANFTAPYTATTIQKLADAGAVTLGKANMDEFAMGSSNENSYFGPVANPWHTDYVPGGSSGGSATVVAAGITPAATGTDTGGSIRQPASFCGVTGLKPTYGRVSRYGMVAFASSLDQAGVLAHSAEDAALMLAYMAGFDPRDSTSSEHQDAWLDEVPERGVGELEAPLTVGMPKEYFAHVSNGAALLDDARRALEKHGFRCREVTLPHTDAAIPAYYVLAGAEASTNLSRYDGVRFGHRCDDPESLEDLYERSRSEGFGAEVKRRILTGTYALSVGYFDAYYVKAQKIRRLIQQDFLDAFTDVDLLMAPTAPGTAFRRGELTEDPVAMYQQDLFTIPVSLAGLPALTLPCGLEDGMPIGLQMIAAHFDEQRLLKTGAAYQAMTDWHTLRPNLPSDLRPETG